MTNKKGGKYRNPTKTPCNANLTDYIMFYSFTIFVEGIYKRKIPLMEEIIHKRYSVLCRIKPNPYI